jgi:hypothetical protein
MFIYLYYYLYSMHYSNTYQNGETTHAHRHTEISLYKLISTYLWAVVDAIIAYIVITLYNNYNNYFDAFHPVVCNNIHRIKV